jgi:hypothetical protein
MARLFGAAAARRLGLVAGTVAAAAAMWAQPAGGACGSWQQIPGAPAVHGWLNDVSASSATDAWAVGQSGKRTLAERWNGSAWRRVATPNPAGRRHKADVLYGVVAIAPDNAWAVGTYGSGPRPLLLHWNGSAWRLQHVPRGARYASLSAITAVSAHDIWAVGMTRHRLTRTLHYDGARWRVVPAVNRGNQPMFVGVAAASSSDVWAVGYSPATLVEHWNGHAWHLVAASRRGGREYGVAALPSGDAWAVGDIPHPTTDVIDHWDGTAWTIDYGTTLAGLRSVAASSPKDVWAVGGVVGLLGGPVVVHWDGTGWSRMVIPTVLTTALSGVAHVPGTGAYWAVGGTLHRAHHTGFDTPRIEYFC